MNPSWQPDPNAFYAHTAPEGRPWEPLFTPACPTLKGEPCEACARLDPDHGHLNKVAHLAARFAAEMFAPESERSAKDGGAPSTPGNAGFQPAPSETANAQAAATWGRLAGLWHDLGKFSNAFQQRLRGKIERANHSTAGAQFAEEHLRVLGHLFAYIIAGHHAGLADLQKGHGSLRSRLQENDFLSPIRSIPEAASILNSTATAPLPPIIQRSATGQTVSFFTRVLFSCLVDADFLATEAFMNRAQYVSRPVWPKDLLAQMEAALSNRFSAFAPAAPNSINAHRETIREHCLEAAGRPPGFHTLTVPTGGGKTLCSLAFALRHARTHRLHRIIYVIPYTSIIEQNAAEFRATFSTLSTSIGHALVLEHHSNFDPTPERENDETPVHKLLSENWDAPLVVTTNVQFFESLAHHKTSRCRKLHNLARSVIIFDEAQSLPPDHLHPCLKFLEQLTTTAGSSVVLCTATQPALGKLDPNLPGDFARSFNDIALPLTKQNEIIPDVPRLFSLFKRTTMTLEPRPLTDDELCARLKKCPRALAILNTKPHATKVFDLLDPEDQANLHLSAQLTPAHRQAVLRDIKQREIDRKPSRLIATTVVEAGVDLSFPVLYRARTGLDSLAQAIGRCNRHGELLDRVGNSIRGQVHFFTPADQPTPDFLKFACNATDRTLPDFEEFPEALTSPEAIMSYFRHAYWQHGGEHGHGWDKPRFREAFEFGNETAPFVFNFKTFSEAFRLIPDTQVPVIIEPHPDYMPGLDTLLYETIPALLETIREADTKHYPPPPFAHRTLQRHTIQIPRNIHHTLTASGDIQPYCDGRFPILTHPKALYHPKLGLRIPTTITMRPEAFMI